MRVKVSEIRSGDQFYHGGHLEWTATSDAESDGSAVQAEVEFEADKGHGPRIWDDPSITLEITRDR